MCKKSTVKNRKTERDARKEEQMNIKELLGESYKDGMTVEELLALAVEAPNTDELGKLKNALSKANGEAAEYRKALKEKMSETEKADAERAERQKQIEEELANLRRDKAISESMTQFLAVGYDEELARKSAEAVADNNFAAIFDGMKAFVASHDKAMEAKLLSGTPKPNGGGAAKPKTVEEIMKIADATERQNAIAENIELFEK